MVFELFTFLIGSVAVAGMAWAIWGVGDTLHPLVYLMPMVGFIYAFIPVSLYHDQGALYYFSQNELSIVQGYNLLCVMALALGCYLSSWKYRPQPSKATTRLQDTLYGKRRATQFAWLLGALGLLAYVYQIGNVGGACRCLQ